MRERGERRRRAGEERGKGRYIEGARDLRAAPFGGGIIIAQRVPAGVAFSTKVLHGRDHEADGSARVILVRRYTKTRFDAGRRVAIHTLQPAGLSYSTANATPRPPGQFGSMTKPVAVAAPVCGAGEAATAPARPLPALIRSGDDAPKDLR